MTREEVKKAAKIMVDFADGAEIQYSHKGQNNWMNWINKIPPSFDWQTFDYRIKPEIKYRSFKTKEECWEEMHKHPDFGWIKEKDTGNFVNIGYIDIQLGKGPIITLAPTENFEYSSLEVFNYYTFTDDKPFGIKEE